MSFYGCLILFSVRFIHVVEYASISFPFKAACLLPLDSIFSFPIYVYFEILWMYLKN